MGDSDRDDDFWKWMDRDKERHKERQRDIIRSQKGKKAKKIAGIAMGIVLAAVIMGMLPAMLPSGSDYDSEVYYHIPGHKLNSLPTFCAVSFDDPNFPHANDRLIPLTEDAVQEWEDRLQGYTGNHGAWDFSFRTVSEGDALGFVGCDAIVSFAALPSSDRHFVRGQTMIGEYGAPEITIFFLDPQNKSEIDRNIEFVILHEIGHVLGLAHPEFSWTDNGQPHYVDNNGLVWSRSIMNSPEIYSGLPDDVAHVITDYDVRAVIDLYGGGISDVPIFFGWVPYAVIAAILGILILVVNRKLKQ